MDEEQNAETHLRSVKWKEGKINIALCEFRDDGFEKETTIKTMEQPHPDLLGARDCLEAAVRRILELPASIWSGRINISGVAWSWNEKAQVKGACIIAQVSLEDTDAPLVLTTPHLPFDQYNESGNAPTMPMNAQVFLNKFEEEAKAFIFEGKRAQGDLFANDPAGKRALDNMRKNIRRGEVSLGFGDGTVISKETLEARH